MQKGRPARGCYGISPTGRPDLRSQGGVSSPGQTVDSPKVLPPPGQFQPTPLPDEHPLKVEQWLAGEHDATQMALAQGRKPRSLRQEMSGLSGTFVVALYSPQAPAVLQGLQPYFACSAIAIWYWASKGTSSHESPYWAAYSGPGDG
jgi:hypothetical protein